MVIFFISIILQNNHRVITYHRRNCGTREDLFFSLTVLLIKLNNIGSLEKSDFYIFCIFYFLVFVFCAQFFSYEFSIQISI